MKIIRSIVLIACLVLAVSNAFAQSLTAQVDRDSLSMGETFRLLLLLLLLE